MDEDSGCNTQPTPSAYWVIIGYFPEREGKRNHIKMPHRKDLSTHLRYSTIASFPAELWNCPQTNIRMCSRNNEGCSRDNTCHSGRSSCHEDRSYSCDRSKPSFTVMTVPVAQDKNLLTQTQKQCPVVYSTPQLQQTQQLKQPIPYPPQQQLKQPQQMKK